MFDERKHEAVLQLLRDRKYRPMTKLDRLRLVGEPNPDKSAFVEESEAGAVTVTIHGRVGYSGKKIHKLLVTAIIENGVAWIARVGNACGSARWSPVRGRSPFFILPDADTVTCQKCEPTQGGE